MAKIELTASTMAHLSLPCIGALAGQPKHLEMDLSRAEMERIVRPVLSRCRAPVEQALGDSGLPVERVDRLVFVGGPTRMPRRRLRAGRCPSRNPPHMGDRPNTWWMRSTESTARRQLRPFFGTAHAASQHGARSSTRNRQATTTKCSACLATPMRRRLRTPFPRSRRSTTRTRIRSPGPWSASRRLRRPMQCFPMQKSVPNMPLEASRASVTSPEMTLSPASTSGPSSRPEFRFRRGFLRPAVPATSGRAATRRGHRRRTRRPVGKNREGRVRWQTRQPADRGQVRPHPLFQREGANLWHPRQIDVADAVLGAGIAVPTLDGEVKVKVPPGMPPWCAAAPAQTRGFRNSAPGALDIFTCSCRCVYPGPCWPKSETCGRSFGNCTQSDNDRDRKYRPEKRPICARTQDNPRQTDLWSTK